MSFFSDVSNWCAAKRLQLNTLVRPTITFTAPSALVCQFSHHYKSEHHQAVVSRPWPGRLLWRPAVNAAARLACVTYVFLSSAPHTLTLSTRLRRHCHAGYSFGAVTPWPLQRCSCGFAGDDTSPSTESTMSLQLCGSCIGCRSQREYSLLVHKCSSDNLRIASLHVDARLWHSFTVIAAFIDNCDLVVPRTGRKISDGAYSAAAPRAWNRLLSELKLFCSTTSFKNNWRVFCFMLLILRTLTKIAVECAISLIVGAHCKWLLLLFTVRLKNRLETKQTVLQTFIHGKSKCPAFEMLNWKLLSNCKISHIIGSNCLQTTLSTGVSARQDTAVQELAGIVTCGHVPPRWVCLHDCCCLAPSDPSVATEHITQRPPS